MSEEVTFNFNELDVQRLNLKQGDTLMVTLKSNDVDEEIMHQIRKSLKKVFPNNEVGVFVIGESDDVRFSIVNDGSTNYSVSRDEKTVEIEIPKTTGEDNG